MFGNLDGLLYGSFRKVCRYNEFLLEKALIEFQQYNSLQPDGKTREIVLSSRFVVDSDHSSCALHFKRLLFGTF